MFYQEKGSALWADILYVEHRVDDDLDDIYLNKIGLSLLENPRNESCNIICRTQPHPTL